MRNLVAVLLIAGLWPVAAADEITACDVEAAHPSDPDHVGEGRGSSEVNTSRAIQACRDAIDEYPDNPRFHYQLGRAMVYEADASGGDDSEGMAHVATAADMGYTQALFVLGLLHLRDGDTCSAEPVTHRAAEQGLKAARLAYVNAYTAGDYADCGVTRSAGTLHAYLDAAAEQVSGYYENMLLQALRRQVDALGEDDE